MSLYISPNPFYIQHQQWNLKKNVGLDNNVCQCTFISCNKYASLVGMWQGTAFTVSQSQWEIRVPVFIICFTEAFSSCCSVTVHYLIIGREMEKARSLNKNCTHTCQQSILYLTLLWDAILFLLEKLRNLITIIWMQSSMSLKVWSDFTIIFKAIWHHCVKLNTCTSCYPAVSLLEMSPRERSHQNTEVLLLAILL